LLASSTHPGPFPEESENGYGKLIPLKDEATGLRLLKLPRGFRYRSLGWHRSPMKGGLPTPPFHDGSAAFAGEEGKILVVRNHEIEATAGVFSPGPPSYDSQAGGGTTTLVFDPVAERLLETRPSLVGTLRNCAGGPTPWGSWLSCEETLAGRGNLGGLEKDHGFVFEVPADGVSQAQPIRNMGRFFHEAVAVDPKSGAVYLSEDRYTAGFYRYLPRRPGELLEGGSFQMLALTERPHADLRTGQFPGLRLPVSWVDISEPERAHSRETPGDCLGVYHQGESQGGATFARLEGVWYGRGQIFFTATNGGDHKAGQVWCYHLEDETLELVYESPSGRILTGPDNLTVSPRGGILICEDGSGRPMRLNQLTPEGSISAFAENHVVINDGKHPFQGDFRTKEMTGACFSPDGKWLFVNVQVPGVTFAITGPWEQGSL
jgi:secreted PhoX family phosphatase